MIVFYVDFAKDMGTDEVRVKTSRVKTSRVAPGSVERKDAVHVQAFPVASAPTSQGEVVGQHSSRTSCLQPQQDPFSIVQLVIV